MTIVGDVTNGGGANVNERRAMPADWRSKLICKATKGGSVPQEVGANVIKVLLYHPLWQGVIVYDEFQQSIVTTRRPPWDRAESPAPKDGALWPRPWTDPDTTRLQSWLLEHVAIHVGTDAIDRAIVAAAECRVIDPPKEYADKLAWDGTHRVDRWLHTHLGVEDSDYSRMVGRWTLIAAVARLYKPGCKHDHVIVLEGPQGARKSTAIRAMFGQWFSDTTLDLSNKDRFMAIQNVWGYELAEFDGYSRHAQGQVKAFVTSPADKFRQPYARRDTVSLRRCVFWATINPSREYLEDETGGRRWWPVKCGLIDLDAINRDRDQLWAEAVELYKRGEQWYPQTPEEHAACRVEQGERQARDAWEQPIESWLGGASTPDRVTAGDVLGGAIGLEKAKWDMASQMRATKCLRALGWQRAPRSGPARMWQRTVAAPAAEHAPAVQSEPTAEPVDPVVDGIAESLTLDAVRQLSEAATEDDCAAIKDTAKRQIDGHASRLERVRVAYVARVRAIRDGPGVSGGPAP